MDIVKRIRTASYTADEAANEIEWLRGELQTAADEIERLREALRMICDGPRDVEKTYAELFVDVKIEARKALREKE